MQSFYVYEAKTKLSHLLEMIESGDEVVIARAGKPVALLTAYQAPRHRIAPAGSLEGQGWIADDFNEAVDHQFDVLGE
jgi:antitoxin (DNA-binding transcriptional repressor) of toxin-antitoxin stability system